jgi:integrase
MHSMAIRKRKIKSGIVWAYSFELPGSNRRKRCRIEKSGFATKKAAQNAESARRILEADKAEAAKRALPAIPKTLGELLTEFCDQHGKQLAPKTTERYREMSEYLSLELRSLPFENITAVDLTREWGRLRESGGHHRRTKEVRALSVKTVRNIAGVVSSAFVQAIGWGLAKFNPVTHSIKPRGGEHRQPVALTPDQHKLLVKGSHHSILPAILEVCAGLGARRGEVLALRWSDIVGDEVKIGRSLTQTRAGVGFKEPKTAAGYRRVVIPEITLPIIEAHRKSQEVFRQQFGADYEGDLVFCNPNGTPLRPDSISSAASALYRRLKLPTGSSLHAQRHTHGSQLILAGMELPAVAKRLGHSSTHVTARIYAHMLDGRDRKAAEVWSAMQRPVAKESLTVEKEKVN